VELDGFDEPIVFDCGSGMNDLGNEEAANPSPRYHVFLSHFHWDHLQGFPFFVPAFNPAVAIDFYSPRPDFEKLLSGLMRAPYSPIGMDYTASRKTFSVLKAPVAIGPATVSFRRVNHPGDAYAYRVAQGGKTFIYSTDTELAARDFARDEANGAFFSGADALVMDSQYTLMEALERSNWGHSSYSMAAEFAAAWGIRHLVMFHHDPGSDDLKLHEMLASARRYLRLLTDADVKVSLATEGMEIVL
jgi:phosphoribosyl 1,2-cyclic phosphodiesterase